MCDPTTSLSVFVSNSLSLSLLFSLIRTTVFRVSPPQAQPSFDPTPTAAAAAMVKERGLEEEVGVVGAAAATSVPAATLSMPCSQ
jgi:hypothetical protein